MSAAARARRLVAPVAQPVTARWRAFKQRDWKEGPPDFVGVGAQRSGTTWWYGLLGDHPGIHGGAKEQHFFDAYFGRVFTDADVAAYHRRFRRPPGKLIGEWTPRYMHDFWTPALLRRAAPEARILVLLRDPLERLRSGLGHELDGFVRDVRTRRRDYAGALVASDALARSLYARQLRGLLEHFDESQVLVLQYERCVADPAAELRRTYEFLGADPADHIPGTLRAPVGRAQPRRELARPVLEPAIDAIREDAAELSAIASGIDLELWPSCRPARPGQLGEG